ncbi:MAG: FAD-binding protein [Bacteriovoracaceae bacterium]|nr:FAD-binding protein [Bacteriovoracaceae bacterium]
MTLYNNIPGTNYLENHDLTTFSTMRLQTKGDIILVASLEALSTLLKDLNKNKKPYRLLGWGANQILRALKNEVYIKLEFAFDAKYFEQVRDEYELPASLALTQLTSHALKFGLKGWEVLTGIPASLGGAIYMNAGTRLGEIKDLLISVSVMDRAGKIREHQVNEKSFSYRHNHFVNDGEVIVGAKLKHYGLDESVPKKIQEYADYRKKTQPTNLKTCGCVFQNYSPTLPAGMAIDCLGLGGLEWGDLEISTKHSNFFVNKGKATDADFDHFVEFVQDLLLRYYFSEFELEVKV